MSIASAIQNAQNKVANAYTAVDEMGGELPLIQNLSNLPTAISTINTGGAIDTLTITPTTSQQTITASGGVDGYSPITVNAVTSSIDANIAAGNIKDGVSILGVTGNCIELNGTTTTITRTSLFDKTYRPEAPYNGFTAVTVKKVTADIDSSIVPENIKSGVNIIGVTGTYTGEEPVITSLSITPTTSSQTITAPFGVDGYSPITVDAVDSSIDSNIIARNIRKDVQILGVTGTYTGSVNLQWKSVTIDNKYPPLIYADSGYDGLSGVYVSLNLEDITVTPSTQSQSIIPSSGYCGIKGVTVDPVTSSIDAHIVPSNIKSGATILGVTGTAPIPNPEYISDIVFINQVTKLTPSPGYTGIAEVEVAPAVGSKTITPTTSKQIINAYSEDELAGYDIVTVNAVTSSIDSNIVANNIKSGVKILGVTGTYVGLNGTTTTIAPTTSSQTVTPSSPYNGFTSVTVSGVTSAIDSNITAGNIRKDVQILGVTGTYTGGANLQSKSVTIVDSYTPTIVPDSGYDGLSSVSVSVSLENLTVTPSTSAQVLYPSSGYCGYARVVVNRVTSNIDRDIQAANIKKGVNILGVTGTYEGLNGTTTSIIPATSSQTVTPSSPYNGFTSVTVPAVTSSIDENITAGNIKNGVTILGVTGTYSGGSGTLVTKTITENGTYYAGSDNADGYSAVTVNVSGGGSDPFGIIFSGEYDSQGNYTYPYDLTYTGNVSFDGIKTITTAGAFASYLYHQTNQPQRLKCRLIAGTVSFPDLETVNANYCFYSLCNGQTQITSVSFPKLTTISGSMVLDYAFEGCSSLTDIYFNSLTSDISSTRALNKVSGCTVHLPTGYTGTCSLGGTRTVYVKDL